MARAALMVVRRKDGRIVLAARNGNRRDLNIIGGHIEPGETAEQAAIREAYEEARIKVIACRRVHQKNGIVTFQATIWSQAPGCGDKMVTWGTWADAIGGTYKAHVLDMLMTLDPGGFMLSVAPTRRHEHICECGNRWSHTAEPINLTRKHRCPKCKRVVTLAQNVEPPRNFRGARP